MNHEPTIELVAKALDAALMRQTAIANNVANANTPDYQTIGVNFETQLQQLSEISNMTLENINPTYELTDVKSPIDEQIALSIKNNTQYRALIKGLNHKLALMSIALEGNHSS